MQRWHFCPLLSLSFNSYYYLPFLPLFLALLLLLFFSPFLLCLRFIFIVWPFFYLFISLLFWVVPRRTTRTVTRKERRTHRKIGEKEERKKKTWSQAFIEMEVGNNWLLLCMQLCNTLNISVEEFALEFASLCEVGRDGERKRDLFSFVWLVLMVASKYSFSELCRRDSPTCFRMLWNIQLITWRELGSKWLVLMNVSVIVVIHLG